jgi:hypothetical protein
LAIGAAKLFSEQVRDGGSDVPIVVTQSFMLRLMNQVEFCVFRRLT